MSAQIENIVEGEPPSTAAIDDVSSAARVDRMMEIAHVNAGAKMHRLAGVKVRHG